MQDTQQILNDATKLLASLKGVELDVLDIKQPPTAEYALHLAKVISKISPLLGNMIEYKIIEELNTAEWAHNGKWIRQDPGFPDALFQSDLEIPPGIEIKTWFPLATEITARFKDSYLHFENNQTNVAVVAWLPENIIYGKPKIIDVWVGSAQEVAYARDSHYHKPPDYLVIEPEDTSLRTANLQQTNTNGFKFQGDKDLLAKADEVVKSWGLKSKQFSTDPDYQAKIKSLLGRFPYRLDTNFAKIDRINHEGLEAFKTRVLNTYVDGKTIKEWSKIVTKDDATIKSMVKELV